MSLPLPVIDRLFARLNATYGRDFMGRYEGQDAGAVKTSWSHELDAYSQNLQPLAWALENLPERPPNVIEFKNICLRAPNAPTARLEAPRCDPKIAAMVSDGLRKTMALQPVLGRLDWAKRILENPKGRTHTVIQMAKNALGQS